MSSHPREQLSALLDGELGPAEQAELRAHVGACPQCAAELQELALVGQAARELDEPAPEGYFDELPGRIRQRLRAARSASVAPPASRRHLLPAWSWAAAAAVLVGVLLPVLWQRQAQAPLPAAAPATVPAPPRQAAGADQQEPAASGPAFQARSPYEAEAKTTAEAHRPVAEEKARAVPAAPPAPPAADESARLGRSAPGFAPAPAAPPPAPAARAEAGAERELAAPAADGGLEESVVVADAARPAAGGAAAPEPRRQTGQDELRKDQAAPQAAAASAESRKKAEQGRAPAENRQPAPGQQKGDAFGDLAARRPGTAAEARELAREWQRQAGLQATPALADEARLRGLEALAAAFRLSGDAADRAALERAVAAYAARPDAAQKRRAAALLEPAGR